MRAVEIKQGNSTQAFLTKITRGIGDEVGYDVDLDPAIIRMIYNRLLVGIDDTNISYILERWFGFLPAEALRLRLTIMQATGTGLTCLTVIGKALLQFPGFCWDRVALLYPAEWRNMITAGTAVGENVWYGYRKNLGNVSSTRYKTIGWIAKMTRFGGDQRIQQYGGWPRAIAQQAIVEEWFREFADHMRGGEGPVNFAAGEVRVPVAAAVFVTAQNPVYM